MGPLYFGCIVLHLFAAFLWLGHMVFWSVVVGPMVKRFEPEARRESLRAAAHRWGGLGWPALTVFLATGVVLLHARGLTSFAALGDLLGEPAGWLLLGKLVLVLAMVLYQSFVGHRPAPRLIYVNMLVALAIVALSVLLVRHPEWSLPPLPR